MIRLDITELEPGSKLCRFLLPGRFDYDRFTTVAERDGGSELVIRGWAWKPFLPWRELAAEYFPTASVVIFNRRNPFTGEHQETRLML